MAKFLPEGETPKATELICSRVLKEGTRFSAEGQFYFCVLDTLTAEFHCVCAVSYTHLTLPTITKV